MEVSTRSFGYINLILILVYFVQTAWALCSECTDESKSTTLTACQSSAISLEEAEELKNVTLVCNRLHELLACVGEKVPQCLEMFSEQYQQYTYTPWDCHMSHDQVITYQRLVQNGCTSKSDPQTSNSALKIHVGNLEFLAVLSGLLLLKNS